VFQASSVLLVATVLFQRPLLAITSGGSSLLLRPWDIAWLLFIPASAAALLTRERSTSVRQLSERLGRTAPALLLAYGALGLASLTWHYVAFRGDAFLDAIVGAGRILAVAYLAVALVLLWTERLARLLRATVVVSALIAAAMALHAYVFATSPAGLGVTRAGGPFGNAFADAAFDRWWAYPAASTELGVWLAGAIVVLVLWSLDPALRIRAPRLRAAGLACAMLLLVVALALTHSRESWVALCGGALIVAWGLRARVSRRQAAAAAAAAAAVVIALVIALPSAGARLTESFQSGSFANVTGPQARFEAWVDSVRIGNDRFPIGWGVSGVSSHADRFGRSTAENMYLQSYMETGILGIALLVALMAAGTRAGLRRLRAAPHDAAGGLAAGLLGVLAVHGVFGNSLGDPSVQILVGVAVAASIARGGAGRDAPASVT
jgi:hypothetical protein